MNFVQIIYEDDMPNELSNEKSNFTPLVLGNSSGEFIPLKNVDDEKLNNSTIVPKNRDLFTQDDAAVQENRNSSVEWGTRETNFLLRKYNKYIPLTGPRKKYHTKKDMWSRISQDMKNELRIERSPFQCENRYKTVLRKWRKQTNKGTKSEERTSRKNCNDDETSTSKFFTFKPIRPSETLDNHNSELVGNEKKNSIAKVLWEIFKKKEEGRERRHKERMELLEKLLRTDQFLN